jgi:hypothetical protein
VHIRLRDDLARSGWHGQRSIRRRSGCPRLRERHVHDVVVPDELVARVDAARWRGRDAFFHDLGDVHFPVEGLGEMLDHDVDLIELETDGDRQANQIADAGLPPHPHACAAANPGIQIQPRHEGCDRIGQVFEFGICLTSTRTQRRRAAPGTPRLLNDRQIRRTPSIRRRTRFSILLRSLRARAISFRSIRSSPRPLLERAPPAAETASRRLWQ